MNADSQGAQLFAGPMEQLGRLRHLALHDAHLLANAARGIV
jgi:hypothetical protein